MASRKSNKTPPRLDEKGADDLEAEFLAKLGGYDSRARVSEGFAQREENEPAIERGHETPADVQEATDGFEQFRDALEATNFATSELTPSVESLADAESPSTAESEDRESRSAAGRRQKLTHAEMMEKAFDSIGSDAAVHASKFRGRGYDVGEDIEIVDDLSLKEELANPDAGRGQDDPNDEDMMFFEMMAADDVRPAEVGRIESRPGRRDIPDAARWRSINELRTLSEKDLLEPTLTREQRARLKRSRKRHIDFLNIRQMRREEAISEVKIFVRGAHRRGIPFVRIITGKGKQSEGLPVLKRAVIEWIEQHGAGKVRGWAPETDRGGNYGSVVVELEVERRDD